MVAHGRAKEGKGSMATCGEWLKSERRGVGHRTCCVIYGTFRARTKQHESIAVTTALLLKTGARLRITLASSNDDYAEAILPSRAMPAMRKGLSKPWTQIEVRITASRSARAEIGLDQNQFSDVEHRHRSIQDPKEAPAPSRSLFYEADIGFRSITSELGLLSTLTARRTFPLISTVDMPFLAKTKTTESNIAPSLFSLLRPSRTFTRESRSPATMDDVGRRGGVWAYMREELPSGVDSLPLAAYAFMSGYLNAVSFTTTTVWCGFMTGNSVILGLALARLSLGHRREDVFAKVDGQACTALVCFVIGIALARVGDFGFWSGRSNKIGQPKPTDEEKGKQVAEPEVQVPAITRSPPSNDQSQDPELGLRPPARKSEEWSESGAPTRVGTPIPSGSVGRMTRIVIPGGPSSVQPSPTGTVKEQTPPTPPAYGRARLWLVVGTLFQAILLVASAVAAIHDHTTPSTVSATRSSQSAGWTSVSGFIALALLSLSMGFQGVMAHRMGSGFGATVVLSSLWVELVGSPGGLRWKSYRGTRVWTIVLFIVGGLVGAVLRDDNVLGISNSLFVGAGFRAAIALSWIFVPATRRN
ncbi:hypothetical protein RhiJN_08950 [Ceratobasidium sp. AG-Ba]|nr:hypothetical protein RhiJN_08950 [Ceratobasidium sp. AG-Ba]